MGAPLGLENQPGPSAPKSCHSQAPPAGMALTDPGSESECWQWAEAEEFGPSQIWGQVFDTG